MEEQNKQELAPKEQILPSVIQDEMKSSYLDYAMSVIVSRALPDVRDGLKPVHRRILFGMKELGMWHSKPTKKSARIVGEILGKFHPHGDVAVYDSLVRMAQDFSLRYPLIEGQGNFGSVDGDSPAAMRYTECRLTTIAEELLTDIDKETVAFQPNFDGSLEEPKVLPAKVPNLLINGASGIAVGMATSIPPHNLNEVCDGAIALIDDPECTPEMLIGIIKGPDFPTGGIIIGNSGVKMAHHYGRGKVTVRSRHEIEENGEKVSIIIREIPYMVNKSALLEQIADLVRNKVIPGIADLRDESDKDGMRMVIVLKKGIPSEVVLNQLWKHSRLQTTVSINVLALKDNQPRTLSLREVLQEFIVHRQIVVRKRAEFDLKKAEKQAHILEGLIKALDDIDRAIQIIKQSKSTVEAMSALSEAYQLTEVQCKSILEMRLQRLTNMEQQKIRDELQQLITLIGELKTILADENKILGIIRSELQEMKEKFGDKRKTDIIEGGDDADIDIEDLIEDAPMVVTITHSGYIKRLPVETYRQQGRGGRGVIGANVKEGDFVEQLFVASAHSYLLIFTADGQVHWLKVYSIPEASRTGMGKAIVNLILSSEKVAAVVPVKEFSPGNYLMMATEKGTVKRIQLDQFSRPRRGGIRALTLDDGDRLIGVMKTNGKEEIMIATLNGMAVRCNETDVRPIGRVGRGVRGITLSGNDVVIGMIRADPSRTVLTVTDRGYGKKTVVEEYRLIGRGGKGVINIRSSEKNGKVVNISSVNEADDIMCISKKGIIIRMPVKGISTIGRSTQGVRLMRIGGDDSVVAVAKVVNEETPDEV